MNKINQDLTIIKLVMLLVSILISFNSFGDSSNVTICVNEDAEFIPGTDELFVEGSYYPDRTTLFTGKDLCKYENGQIKSKGNYKDGLVNENFTTWFKNGQMSSLKFYKDKKEHIISVLKYSRENPSLYIKNI